jgi:hypothetical protein
VYVPVLSEEGIRSLFGDTVFRLLGIAVPLPFESHQLTLVQVQHCLLSAIVIEEPGKRAILLVYW